MSRDRKYNYELADKFLYGTLKEYAKQNRKNMTEAESALWHMISNNALGTSFRRQFIIKDYIVDFFSLEYKIIIEIDGGYHSQPEQMILDEKRTKEIEHLGFRVIRFTNEQVLFDTNNVLTTIKNLIQ